MGLVLAATLVVAAGEARNSDDRNSDERATTSSRGAASTKGAPGAAAMPKLDNGVTNGDGSEVIRQPDGSAAKGLPGLSKSEQSTKVSLLTEPLPDTASSAGSMVAGFPVSVIPLPAGAVVRSSGVSTTKTTMQVSVVASSSKSPRAVLAFYRKALSAHGFAEGSVPASGGSTASSFTRGADHLVVTTTVGAKNTNYSLFGTLHAER